MKKEVEDALVSKYPSLFQNRCKTPQESLMCFGCECGDGWEAILDNLFGYFEHLRESSSKGVKIRTELTTAENGGYMELRCPLVILDQVKEKYGTLRVYWHFETGEIEAARSSVEREEDLDQALRRYSDTVENAIDFTEYLSSKTCEITGRPGTLYTHGWCVTLCDDEAVKRFGVSGGAGDGLYGG